MKSLRSPRGVGKGAGGPRGQVGVEKAAEVVSKAKVDELFCSSGF